MKEVSRNEFRDFVSTNFKLIPHTTEGYQISVIQYLSQDSQKVRAQATYSRLVEGCQVDKRYYIEDDA